MDLVVPLFLFTKLYLFLILSLSSLFNVRSLFVISFEKLRSFRIVNDLQHSVMNAFIRKTSTDKVSNGNVDETSKHLLCSPDLAL